jgi:hypothetical protein
MEGMEWISSSISLCLWNLSKQHQFCPKFDDRVLNFRQQQPKKWCGLTEMGTQELVNIASSLIGLI